ncbi:AAA family ATPase [Ruminococcus albus]|uniref:AAA domain-containing protein, putative AbiEii toxin, Type IV TA system n=1 Tax=Ruminococcus albus TaxID=1264 RepID=A0A1I1K2I5_RUMAL|nr:AAA family ATPase [Ruminococcus albus]SFC52193.1 AAA domain-containing protein, putative AbiEii toxin, Type IV TA system [Ruminococcus albus]
MNEENMKIKIHYIWFKDYRGFINQGINLSSKYDFKYYPDDGEYGSVTIKNNSSDYIEDFFGKNIDVTAIVGQNGIGKTSLLRFFLSLKTPDKLRIECAIIFEINAIFYITIKIKGKEKITFEITKNKISSSNKLILGDAHTNSFAFKNHIRYIYLTEMFNMNQYTASEFGEDDLSFASVLYNQTTNGNEEKHVDNPVTRYIHRINEWQLAFLSNGREFVEQFKIGFPPYLNIVPSYDENAFNDFYIKALSAGNNISPDKKENLKKDATELCNTFLKKDDTNVRLIENKCATAIFMNIFSSLKGNGFDEAFIIYHKIMTEIFNSDEFKNATCAWETVGILLRMIKNNDLSVKKNGEKDATPLKNSIDAESYIAFMDYFQSIISDKNTGIIVIHNKKIKLYLKPFTIQIPTENTEQIYEFFEKYIQCISTVDFLSFSWGLSSGETLLLNQFGKLMHILKKDPLGNYYLPEDNSSPKPAQNAVIMLDEAEVAFHPEWQRLYFEQFLNFVKKNISRSGTHVQIIIATHSPIMLSDIPRQNTLLLKKDNKTGEIIPEKGNETFAANIFSLYQNSFFIDDTGIGAFAKNRLEDIVKAIHKNNQKKTKVYDTELMECSNKELMKYIESVGDVYLRAKLKQEFFMYRDMDKKTKEDIKVNQMRAKLRENYKEIAKTKAELKKKDDEVAKKKAALEEKDVELAKKNKELEELKKKVEALTNDKN